MSRHDFGDLFEKYPSLIQRMPDEFTSHAFILELARQYQKAYIEALFSYRNHLRDGKEAPFMIVHGILSGQLSKYPEKIELIKAEYLSKDIFGQSNTCGLWRKIK